MQTLLKEYTLSLLRADKYSLKQNTLPEFKKDSFIMVKGLISQKYIKIINLYAPNIINSKYIM